MKKNKQLASQKAARADAKRKKSDEKKRKRKPKDRFWTNWNSPKNCRRPNTKITLAEMVEF